MLVRELTIMPICEPVAFGGKAVLLLCFQSRQRLCHIQLLVVKFPIYSNLSSQRNHQLQLVQFDKFSMLMTHALKMTNHIVFFLLF